MALDLHAQEEIARHPPDDEQLLIVFLAEDADAGADDTEELRDHRRDPKSSHDHRYENNDTRHFPLPLAQMGYAYTLTHPGVPCVFWSHYFDWGEPIRRLIERLIAVRSRAGLHSRSHVDIREARRRLYAAIIDSRVAVKIGADSWCPGAGWHLAADADRLAVWTRE